MAAGGDRLITLSVSDLVIPPPIDLMRVPLDGPERQASVRAAFSPANNPVTSACINRRYASFVTAHEAADCVPRAVEAGKTAFI